MELLTVVLCLAAAIVIGLRDLEASRDEATEQLGYLVYPWRMNAVYLQGVIACVPFATLPSCASGVNCFSPRLLHTLFLVVSCLECEAGQGE